MRAAVVDVRKSPPGVNLAYPLRAWTLTGGATYDPATDSVTIPLGGTVYLPGALAAKTDGRRWRVQLDVKGVPGTTGRPTYTTAYMDRAKGSHMVPGGWFGNGFLPTPVSDEWQTWSNLAASSMWDAEMIFMTATISAQSIYIDGPLTIRNPVITTV